MSANSLHFGIRAFDASVRLSTSCKDAHEVLVRFVFPSWPRVEVVAGSEDISIEVTQSADQIDLWSNGNLVTSASDTKALVPEVMRLIDETMLRKLIHFRAVHCGVVAYGGRALLLPGPTHSGKSSMVAELLCRGATYLSDEYAMIDEQGLVHPYPRPLLLRNGRPRQVAVPASDYNSSIAQEPLPAGWIISLRYDSNVGWDVVPIPKSMAFLNLLKNTPHKMVDLPEMAGTFRSLVASADCFDGTRGEVDEAADRIVKMIGA